MALDTLDGAGSGAALLVDCAWSVLDRPLSREALAPYLRALRARDHRVVLQVQRPADLPDVHEPDLLCTFRLSDPEGWYRRFPRLAGTGIDRRGPLDECVLVTPTGERRGAIEVG